MENNEVSTEEAVKNDETTEKVESTENEELNTAEEESESSAEAVDDNVQELKKDEDYKSKYFYLAAEFENTRKRFEREKQNLVKFGNEKILGDLLEVVDNLERTMDAISADEDEKVKNIAIGIEFVQKQFFTILENHGLTIVEALGKPFDPNFHEAMSTEEKEGTESGIVLKVFQNGWVLNGRLLRAAKVIVSK